MTDLSTYIPEVRHIEIGGKTLAIGPLKVRQIPPFTRTLGPAFGTLSKGDITAAIELHGERIIEAMAVATDEPVAWIGDLPADAFLLLVAEVTEVNTDFFVQRVQPMLNLMINRLAQTVGEIASPSSCQAGSPSANAPN